MKNTKAVLNQAGGYDLITERDGGNPIRILTGKKESSKKYFTNLKRICEQALSELSQRPEVEPAEEIK